MKFCIPGKKLGQLKQKKYFQGGSAPGETSYVITVLFNVPSVGILQKHKLQAVKMCYLNYDYDTMIRIYCAVPRENSAQRKGKYRN